MNDTVIFFLGQSLVILLALVAAYVGIKVQIAKLETTVAVLKDQHVALSKQIGGVSRSLATLHGKCAGVRIEDIQAGQKQ
jgi:hypothetical protein